MMKRIVFLMILFSGLYKLEGQVANIGTMSESDCTMVIELAEKLFQDGRYDECIINLEAVLNSCVLSKAYKTHSLELLAKAYCETDDIENAEATVNLMLNISPHYELTEADNSEVFNRLFKKYRVRPRFSIGARNTANWITYKQAEIFSVLDGLDYSVPYNINLIGIFQGFGLCYYGWVEFEFVRDISINTDFTFMWSKYDRSFSQPPGFELDFWEKDNYIEIPVYLKKYFHIGNNVLPYIAAGMGWLYMTSANGNAEISYTRDDIITGKNIDFYARAENINMLDMRNRSTFEWIAGVGVGYKMKNLRLFLDARYYHGMKSITNTDNRLNNSTLINDYFYVDNSVKLNQFEIGASISYTLKNSVKRIRY